jgi:predicted DNA-binding protein (MmcQ/YjbR family)
MAIPRATKEKDAARGAAKVRTASKPLVSKHPPKSRTREMLTLIDALRHVCLALPDTTEQEAWAEPTFRVGGRMFAMCHSDRAGEPQLSVRVAAALGAQEALVESDPRRFYRPPYVGSKGWVGIVLDADIDWKMVASLVKTAHGLIASRSRER